MTYSLEWRNEAKTILAKVEGNHTDIIEPGHPEWAELSQAESIIPFVPPVPDYAGEARAKRNALLAASDWTQLPDAPVDAAEWALYRQELRGITEQPGFPANVIWPVPPTAQT